MIKCLFATHYLHRMLPLTIIIVATTCITSYIALNNEKVMGDFIFNPSYITNDRQWYRFLSSGFIHADLPHLGFNMFTLYFFGTSWEQAYIDYLEVHPSWYIIMYLSAIVVSSIPSYLKQKNNYHYYSLGASGAVSAIVFSMILLMPWSTLYVFFFPVPAIIYAFLYLGYTFYMSKKGGDSINHDAHLWGAIYGIVFSLVLRPSVASIFLTQILHPKFSVGH